LNVSSSKNVSYAAYTAVQIDDGEDGEFDAVEAKEWPVRCKFELNE